MIEINTIIISIICFCGLIAGLIIAKLTPEEFDYSKKYLKIIYMSILILLLGIVFLSKNYYFIMLSVLSFPLGVVLFEKRSNPAIIYLFLGLVLVSKSYYEIGSVLTFIIGIPIGVLMKNLSKKRFAQKIIMTVAAYFAIIIGFLMI